MPVILHIQLSKAPAMHCPLLYRIFGRFTIFFCGFEPVIGVRLFETPDKKNPRSLTKSGIMVREAGLEPARPE